MNFRMACSNSASRPSLTRRLTTTVSPPDISCWLLSPTTASFLAVSIVVVVDDRLPVKIGNAEEQLWLQVNERDETVVRRLSSADSAPRSLCLPTSHCQNNTELCIAAHHSSVSFSRLFEWIGFDHRTHAG